VNQPGPAPRPIGRYGERSPRRHAALVVVVGLVAVAFLGWLGWAALHAATPASRSEVLAFTVVNPHQVRVRFEVTAAHGSPVTCSLQAIDASHTTVGISSVVVPAAAQDRREAETVITTRDKAVTAIVAGCRVATKN
jgi:hypothetical protein